MTTPTPPKKPAAAAAAPATPDPVDTTPVVEEAPVKYIAVFGDLVDPVSGIRFTTGEPTPSDLTGWMRFQIEHGKLKEFSA